MNWSQKGMGEMMEFDRIMELIFAISESELTEFEYRGNDVELCMRKERKERKRQRDIPDPDKPSLETEKKEACVKEGCLVKSPMVGIFYEIEGIMPGTRVEKGQLLGNIEAMKMMNEIKSTVSGTVKAVKVDNESLVEYDQPLLIVQEDKA